MGPGTTTWPFEGSKDPKGPWKNQTLLPLPSSGPEEKDHGLETVPKAVVIPSVCMKPPTVGTARGQSMDMGQ